MLSTLLLLLTPCFCSRLFRSGSWILVSLYLLSSICPNCTCSVIFSLIFSLCILLLEERFVQVQTLQHCPSLSHPPLRDSTSLFLICKDLTVSSSDTSSNWMGATDTSLSQRCRSPSMTVSRICFDLGQLLEQVELEASGALLQALYPRRHKLTNLTKMLNKQVLKKENYNSN